MPANADILVLARARMAGVVHRENLVGLAPIISERTVGNLTSSDPKPISVVGLRPLFVHPELVELFKRYPEVFLIDYKANRFGTPLLNAVGAITLETSSFVAFVPLTRGTDEDRPRPWWRFKNLIRGEGIPNSQIGSGYG